MTIVSQDYNNFINNLISNEIFKATSSIQLNSVNHTFNYINMLKRFDDILNKTIIFSIQAYLEQLDNSYTHSLERKSKYHIKDYRSRTILTIFGELTFKRHFFKSKLTGRSFCFLDRQLGLHKYEYFDPYIRSLVIDKASQTSISEASRFVNELIGNRISLSSKFQFLSRQSARNILLKSLVADELDKQLDTPDELYVIADEKWISIQSKNSTSKHKKNTHDKKVMVKSIVIFDGYKEDGKRRYLNHKKVFASIHENIITQSLDYISNTYDTEKIKKVFIMGDGASWIKSLPPHYKFSSHTETIYCLDKFHFKQSLHHLAMSSHYEKYLLKFILENNRNAFDKLVAFILKNTPKREDTISKKYQYIILHWKDIQNLYRYQMSCPMESQISHNIAYLTSSRPKGYSHRMLKIILNLRMKYINGHNIKKLYLYNFYSNKTQNISIEHLNFDVFNRYKQFVPYYHHHLFTPSIGIHF